MTDPAPEGTVEAPVVDTPAEATEASETTSRRKGRPRPDSTIERDEQVLAVINRGPATRKQIVEELSLDGNKVYLSLFRLNKDGKIKRGRQGADHVWTAVEPDAA